MRFRGTHGNSQLGGNLTIKRSRRNFFDDGTFAFGEGREFSPGFKGIFFQIGKAFERSGDGFCCGVNESGVHIGRRFLQKVHRPAPYGSDREIDIAVSRKKNDGEVVAVPS